MFSTQEEITFLETSSFLNKLNKQQLKELVAICAIETCTTGEVIFKQGDIGGVMYIVVEGKVLLERELDQRDDTISMNIVKPKTSFGEISLFVDAPRSVTASAMEDTKLLSIKNDDFIVFIRQYPDVLIELNQMLCQRLIEAYDKISEIAQPHKPRELRKLYEKLDF
ncbi:MAG: hypothetical protein B6243_04095 [Anaerolineaceae bacterium 4572_5.2]|nr:MAG: hypothetical protein B6243_04095 [Anaerolineaceae bacterium 4572_5.2]